MCGIVGYISKERNPNSLRLGLEALKRLEYRGYDSAGFAFWDAEKKEIVCQKSVGKIAKLEEKVNGNGNKPVLANPIILHTRWATTGEVTEINAHPHSDCAGKIWLAHNGIIENFHVLKQKLEEEGHKLSSDTDTEVIAHMIEKFFSGNLEDAVRKALPYLKGTYGLVVISKDDPEKLVAAKLGSPLLVGLGENEYLVASDPAAVIAHTKKVIYLDDGEMVSISPNSFSITKGYNVQQKKPENIEWDMEDAQKGGHPHFMLKEILDQPESINNSIRGRVLAEEGKARLGGIRYIEDKLREVEKIKIVACGTAYYAGLIGKYMLEEYGGVPVEVDLASEFRYRKPILDKKTMVIAVSQSGETADTLGAIKEAKEKGAMILGIVNAVGSAIARESGVGIYNHAGPEIGVASTKAFTSQVTILALLSLYLGRQRGLSLVMGQRIAKEILSLPGLVRETLNLNDRVRELAGKYKDYDNFLYLGRKYNLPVALEGALKLKEISYIHAEGYGAGEMKHGPIALIDENFPSIVICPSDSVYDKVVSCIEQIRCRKGKVVVIATEGNENIKKIADDVIYIPKTLEMLTPIVSVVPLQLFAYHMAALRGCEIDKPRNLAKSVTVE
ncbi:MAG: glutamine--fructose-6-phosphate transaminase (isomerizing) [Candidatus Pacebacteria bacterium]|nr:glutamine--fructose-6-phosphate transaminase (isomerizing) [Candidatus Paceibacterota bacterium]